MNQNADFEEPTPPEPPNPNSGFESAVVYEITRLVAQLPTDVAQLTFKRVPGHPEWPEPYFEIIPSNPKAAVFKGVAVATDLNLTIGHSWREFYGFARGGTVEHGATWREELRSIWLAVLSGQLTERLSLDSRGYVIGWDSRLIVNGKEIVFRNGRRAEGLFGKERVEIVVYEPYIRD